MITSRQEFVIEEVRTFEQIQENWPFFLEGLNDLNHISKIEREVPSEEFLKMICRAACGGAGVVWITKSINNKPLFYGIVLDDTAPFKHKTLLIYAAYSNKKNNQVTQWTLDRLEAWAKTQGYKELHAFSYRFSKAGYSLFTRIWNFKRKAILFTKEL